MRPFFLSGMAGFSVVVTAVVMFSSPLALAATTATTTTAAALTKKTHSTKRTVSSKALGPLARMDFAAFRKLAPWRRVEVLKAYRDFFEAYEKSATSRHASAAERGRAQDALRRMQQLFALMNEAQAADEIDDAMAANEVRICANPQDEAQVRFCARRQERMTAAHAPQGQPQPAGPGGQQQQPAAPGSNTGATGNVDADLATDGGSDSFDCFYGGWPSHTRTVTIGGASRTLCQSPAALGNDTSYPRAQAGQSGACAVGTLLCQPALFGDGLCVPQARREDRDSTFQNCSRSFRGQGRTLPDLAKQLVNDFERFQPLFDEMKKTATEVCGDGPAPEGAFQKELPMCRALLRRVQDVQQSIAAERGFQARQPTPAAPAEGPQTSAIDIASAMACYRKLNFWQNRTSPATNYPDNVIALPGRVVANGTPMDGAIVFMTNEQGAGGRAVFCPGARRNDQGIFEDFTTSGARGLSAEGLTRCRDYQVGSSGFALFQALQGMLQNVLTTVRDTGANDAELSRRFKEVNHRDATAEELIQVRNSIRATGPLYRGGAREAMQVCNNVSGEERLRTMARNGLTQLDDLDRQSPLPAAAPASAPDAPVGKPAAAAPAETSRAEGDAKSGIQDPQQ